VDFPDGGVRRLLYNPYDADSLRTGILLGRLSLFWMMRYDLYIGISISVRFRYCTEYRMYVSYRESFRYHTVSDIRL
jgi:hypothetical protein